VALKLFTFIGTNDYIPCYYKFGEHTSSAWKFFQTALVQLFMDSPDEERKVCVFMTSLAEEKNWLGSEQPPGLPAEIDQLKNSEKYRDITLTGIKIPEGFSKEEIWRIFEALEAQVEPGDKIIFDITHSFRTIPLLTLVLINYVRMFKEFEVYGVYYGAFEKLGPAKVVSEMPLKNRIADIVDITELIKLFEWSSASDKFIASGNAKQLCALAKAEITPIKRQFKNTDVVNKHKG